MSIDTRRTLITTLETRQKTRIISYLTGDRANVNAQIGMDAVPLFRRHLEQIGDVESITLFLYSRGGDTNVPWRLVNLIREYTSRMDVLVPFRAHSAATLLCLGANRIIMGKMGELSSIDPSVANQFNPPDPLNQIARIPISVEDVNAYKDLARRFGVKEEDSQLSAQVFMVLASKIDPLALGNVERSYNQIRALAKALLHLHLRDSADTASKITELVKTLTEKLYSHQHLISRRDAAAIGLPVEAADKELDGLLWKLYSDYAEEMELDGAPFNPAQILGSQQSVQVEVKRAFIESSAGTDAFVTKGKITRHAPTPIQLPPGLQIPPAVAAQAQVAFQIESEAWKALR